MLQIYDVKVVEENGTETIYKFHGFNAAMRACCECGTCTNVAESLVEDLGTGEVMLHIENHIITWISGIGNPLKI